MIGKRIRITGRELILDLRAKVFDAAVIANVNNQLCIGAIQLFRGVGQQKTKATLTDHRGHVGNFLELTEVIFNFLHPCDSFVDVGSLRQPDVQHKLRARRRRKEALVDERKSP